MADSPSRLAKASSQDIIPVCVRNSDGMCFSEKRRLSFRRGTGFLCPVTRACPAWNRHLAIGRCGPGSEVVVHVVVVQVPFFVDHAGVVSVVSVGRAQPPAVLTLSLYVIRPEGAYNPNRFRSLTIQAPSRFRQSYTRRVICSNCFGRMHSCSMASWAIYPSSLSIVCAFC